MTMNKQPQIHLSGDIPEHLLPKIGAGEVEKLRDGLADKAWRRGTLLHILNAGPLFYESCRRHGLVRHEELISELRGGLLDELPTRLRENWKLVMEHIEAVELGIGTERYNEARRKKEESVTLLWARLRTPETRAELDRILADTEPGILQGYTGPVADFGGFVAKMRGDSAADIVKSMGSDAAAMLQGMEPVQDPVFPPISMAYRVLHSSWKAYRLRNTMEQRCRFLLSLSPGFTAEKDPNSIPEALWSGLNPFLHSLIQDVMQISSPQATPSKTTESDLQTHPANEKWKRDMQILLAAESLTGNILRAMRWVGGSPGDAPPEGSVNEAEALVLETYGLLR